MTTYIGNIPGLNESVLWRFVATEGQTVFTGPSANGLTLNFSGYRIQVYINGLLITPGIDFTTPTTSTVTISTALSAGDEVIIIGVGLFNLANHYNIQQIQSLLGTYRNRLINATGMINQRGYVSATNTTGANQYTVDRWRVVVSGQNLIFAPDNGVMLFGAPAGGVEQVIEGANMLPGGNYTLSWVGTATATVNGTAVANGGTINLPANTNATVRFINGTFSLPQLEPGNIATPFEHRPRSVELALCQRYYSRGFLPLRGVVNSTNLTRASRMGMVLPQRMRAAPIVTVTGSVFDGTDTRTVSSVIASFNTSEGVEVDLEVSTAFSTGGRAAVLFGPSSLVTADTEL